MSPLENYFNGNRVKKKKSPSKDPHSSISSEDSTTPAAGVHSITAESNPSESGLSNNLPPINEKPSQLSAAQDISSKKISQNSVLDWEIQYDDILGLVRMNSQFPVWLTEAIWLTERGHTDEIEKHLTQVYRLPSLACRVLAVEAKRILANK